jgi:hypothetical protein
MQNVLALRSRSYVASSKTPDDSVARAELTSFRYHFGTAHRPPQCNRCYRLFQNRNGLKEHNQAPVACSNGLPSLKEGIDDGQWEEIEIVLKSKKGEKHINDVSRWYSIWGILFPGVKEPSNPCR